VEKSGAPKKKLMEGGSKGKRRPAGEERGVSIQLQLRRGTWSRRKERRWSRERNFRTREEGGGFALGIGDRRPEGFVSKKGHDSEKKPHGRKRRETTGHTKEEAIKGRRPYPRIWRTVVLIEYGLTRKSITDPNEKRENG